MSYRKPRVYEQVRGTDYTNTTNTYTDIVSQTLTIGAGENLLVSASGPFSAQDAGGAAAEFILVVDGLTKQYCRPVIVDGTGATCQLVQGFVSFSRLIEGLSPGSHTVKVQGRADAAGITLTVEAAGFFAMQVMVLP
jgi:hypothetical protein